MINQVQMQTPALNHALTTQVVCDGDDGSPPVNPRYVGALECVTLPLARMYTMAGRRLYATGPVVPGGGGERKPSTFVTCGGWFEGW
jgi:hypothetical protein